MSLVLSCLLLHRVPWEEGNAAHLRDVRQAREAPCSSPWRPGGAGELDSGSCSSTLVAVLFPEVSACKRYSEEPYFFLLELDTKSLLSSGSVLCCQAAAAVGSFAWLLRVTSSDALKLLLVLRDPNSGALQELAVALVLDEVCSRESVFELFPSTSKRSTEDLHEFVALEAELFSTLI